MSRKNSKSGQKQRSRVTRDLPVRNTKNSKDAKGGHTGSMQVSLGDGSVRSAAGDGSVLVALGDGSVRTVGY
jgi:hypothetical protein